MTQEQLRQWIADQTAGRTDKDPVELIERVEVRKFDKTDVTEPGVDGLVPYDVVVYETRYVVGSPPGVVAPVESPIKEG